MKALMFAIAATSLVASTPVFATSVDPQSVLYDLRSESHWKESRSTWDGHVGRPKSLWAWQMKVTYSITPKGRMANCNVVAPSGSAEFDNAACSKLVREIRFEPKRDVAGRAVRSSGEVSFSLRPYPAALCATGWDELEE